MYYEVLLPYNINMPTESNVWNSKAYSISIFGIIDFIEIDAKNIYTLLLYMADFIRARKVKTSSINNVKELKGFGDTVFNFVLSIYKANQDAIFTDNHDNFFRNRITNKFTLKVKKPLVSSKAGPSENKQAEIVRISPSIPVYSLKKVLEKSKFFDKKCRKPINTNKAPQKLSYAQVVGPSISNILKLKDNFPNLLTKKIENIQRIIDNSNKTKYHIKMTTKGPS